MPSRDSETVTEWNRSRDGRAGRNTLANLRQAVHDPGYLRKFPTPRAEDGESTGGHRGIPDSLTSYTRLWPTPRSNERQQKNSQDSYVALSLAVQDTPQPGGLYSKKNRALWTTPMANTNHTSDGAKTGWSTSGPPREGPSFGLADVVPQTERQENKTSWPTPLAGNPDPSSGGNHGGMALLNAAIAQDKINPTISFGTPTASMKVRSKSFLHKRIPNPAEFVSNKVGQLNPDWVELLMGWPQGWTSPQPLDPKEFDQWMQGFEYNQPITSTTRPSYGPSAWGDGSWETAIPRTVIGASNRVNRLKAIGNGQVPLCAATAAEALFEMLLHVEETLERTTTPPMLDLEDFLSGV